MKTLIASAAVALAFAAPAFANSQLEAQLGVEPGVYTTAELLSIKGSYDSENSRYVFPAPKVSGDTSATVAQLGAIIGQDVTGATFEDVAAAFLSKDSEDSTFPEVGGAADVMSTRGGIGAGHAQLAAKLGVDANDYTVSELAILKVLADEDSE